MIYAFMWIQVSQSSRYHHIKRAHELLCCYHESSASCSLDSELTDTVLCVRITRTYLVLSEQVYRLIKHQRGAPFLALSVFCLFFCAAKYNFFLLKK